MPSSSVLSVPAAIGVVTLCLGVLSCLYIIRDQRRRPAPAMPVMTWVWPINALWAGPLAVWAYRSLGAGRLPRNGERGSASAGPGMTRAMDMARMDMSGRDMPGMSGKRARPFWQSVVTGTLHCGATKVVVIP